MLAIFNAILITMFGTYRTLLALMVASHHLLPIPIIGHYAVHGFFILSGYLMTYIMVNSYGYSLSGLKKFALNRFLRLYPSYWLILLFSLGIVWLFGEELTHRFNKSIFWPKSFKDWLQNLSLVYANPYPVKVVPRLSPPTWALTVEIFYYLLIGLGVSKTKRLTLIWLAGSIGYMVATHALHLGYGYRYNMLLAGSFPFAIGASLYHFKDSLLAKLQALSKPLPILMLFIFMFLNAGIAAYWIGGEETEVSNQSNGWLLNFSYYSNYFLNALLIISLIKGRLPLISKSFDQYLGDYSYPLYLLHWQMGFLVAILVVGEPVRGSITFAGGLLLSVMLAWFIIRYLDGPVQALRQKIKDNNRVKSR